MSKTVGEVFAERGPCVLMERVVALAEAVGRIPVRHWVYDLGDGYQLTVNGTKDKIDALDPWHSMVSHNGWPIVLFDTVDGTQVGSDGEERAIAALDAAILRARPSIGSIRKNASAGDYR